MAYVRTVKTASGATAVQIVHGSRRGARTIEHVGSAHDEQSWRRLDRVITSWNCSVLARGRAGLDPPSTSPEAWAEVAELEALWRQSRRRRRAGTD